MSETPTADSQACGMPTAGEQHFRLTPFVGKFRSTVKLWMGPGEPMISTGTMTNTLELNGLYLQQDYVGDPSDGPFPSFLGKGFWGYNPHTQQYEGFWIDTAASMMQFESGDVDPSGRVWNNAQYRQDATHGRTTTTTHTDHVARRESPQNGVLFPRCQRTRCQRDGNRIRAARLSYDR